MSKTDILDNFKEMSPKPCLPIAIKHLSQPSHVSKWPNQNNLIWLAAATIKMVICDRHRKPRVTCESRQRSLQVLANIKTTAFLRKAKIVVEMGNLESVCPKGFHTVSLNGLAFYNSLEFLTFISYFYSQKNFKCNSTSTISPSGRKCTSTKETQSYIIAFFHQFMPKSKSL